MKNGILIFIPCLIIVVITYLAITMSSVDKIQLGHYTFEIPKEYSQESTIPKWLSNLPGLADSSRSYYVMFPAEEIGSEISGYQVKDGRLKEDIRVIFDVLTPTQIKRRQSSEHFTDMWAAEGSYRERIIEPHPSQPWFKIYRKIEHPRKWVLTSQSPEDGKLLPDNRDDFWIANCSTGIAPATESGKRTHCNSDIFYDDMLIDFGISEQNLHLLDEVKVYLKAKIESWKAAE